MLLQRGWKKNYLLFSFTPSRMKGEREQNVSRNHTVNQKLSRSFEGKFPRKAVSGLRRVDVILPTKN